jgi:hypothetical protein
MSIQVVRHHGAVPVRAHEYVSVRVQPDPHDETMTLATIERFVEKRVVRRPDDSPWHVKTIVCDQPMSPDAAIGFATCYAERKQIPVVYADTE